MRRRTLSRTEAAARLGVHPQTLINWRARNYGPPSTKIGGRLEYDSADLEAWIKAQFAAARQAVSR